MFKKVQFTRRSLWNLLNSFYCLAYKIKSQAEGKKKGEIVLKKSVTENGCSKLNVIWQFFVVVVVVVPLFMGIFYAVIQVKWKVKKSFMRNECKNRNSAAAITLVRWNVFVTLKIKSWKSCNTNVANNDIFMCLIKTKNYNP